ncbi:hypothetical protein ACFQVA_19175 [Actinomadura keratinilytica]
MVPVFGLSVWLLVWARADVLRAVRAHLPAYVAASWLAPAEPAALATMNARHLARDHARRAAAARRCAPSPPTNATPRPWPCCAGAANGARPSRTSSTASAPCSTPSGSVARRSARPSCTPPVCWRPRRPRCGCRPSRAAGAGARRTGLRAGAGRRGAGPGRDRRRGRDPHRHRRPPAPHSSPYAPPPHIPPQQR